MKIKVKETQIQLSILQYLKTIGAYAGKTKTMGVSRNGKFTFDIYTFRGFPDITFFYKHKIGFIEVKSLGNKQTKEQKIFQDYCNNSGILYILAYSLDDVINIV